MTEINFLQDCSVMFDLFSTSKVLCTMCLFQSVMANNETSWDACPHIADSSPQAARITDGQKYWVILHDSVLAHESMLCRKVTKQGTVVLSHLLNSPDFEPCNFVLTDGLVEELSLKGYNGGWYGFQDCFAWDTVWQLTKCFNRTTYRYWKC